MLRRDLYHTLVALADSLNEHVGPDEVADALVTLAAEVRREGLSDRD